LSVEGRFRSQPWLSDDLEGYKTEAVGFLDVPPGALSDRFEKHLRPIAVPPV
jgi:hypothetical protein